jgi:hypothetical protein
LPALDNWNYLGIDLLRRQANLPLLQCSEKPLFHDVGASLANGGVLIAGAAAASDRTDHLAAFDKGKAAGTGDQTRIERAYIGMAGFKYVVERSGLAAMARRGAGLAHATVTPPIWAPSIRENCTSSPLVSTTAMFIFQFRFLASASAAAVTCLARSSPIDRP